METIITELSKYLIIILMILYTFQCFTIFKKHDLEDKRQVLRKQIILMLFMNFVAYAVLYMKTEDSKMIFMYMAVFIFIAVVQILYRVIYKKGNLLIVNNMCMLLSIGFLILSRLQFEKAVTQFEIVAAGMALSFVVPVIVRKVKMLKDLTWLYGILGIGLLGVVLVLAAVSGGAKLSVTVGGITLQLSELVKITFVFFVAGMLREDTSFRRVVITTAVAAAHVLILVVSKDLGSAVVFFVAYLVMLYVATKKPLYALAGLAGGAGASVVAYFLFNHVRQRVEIWQDPIAVYDKVGGGYQTAQGLFGISAGGWFGMGLGEGMPDIIPVVTKDFIFAAICEELGAIFAICLLLVCMSMFLMIVNVSMKMSKPFYKLIAMGLGAEYAFQVFLTVGGSSNFIPMTGITLPLVSYGGSSVICTILMLAIIQGLYILREDEGEELERQRRENEKRKKIKKKNGRGGNGPSPGGTIQREKTLEEKIQEQTEKSLNW
ncbi:MAG: FtsW/RodA/SpoVE family cell cycle protein [Clostridiales bacterium]|nr:FtsW/RodA/SpoVE family cell cycle protein [Clostridiales bacterium]